MKSKSRTLARLQALCSMSRCTCFPQFKTPRPHLAQLVSQDQLLPAQAATGGRKESHMLRGQGQGVMMGMPLPGPGRLTGGSLDSALKEL